MRHTAHGAHTAHSTGHTAYSRQAVQWNALASDSQKAMSWTTALNLTRPIPCRLLRRPPQHTAIASHHAAASGITSYSSATATSSSSNQPTQIGERATMTAPIAMHTPACKTPPVHAATFAEAGSPAPRRFPTRTGVACAKPMDRPIAAPPKFLYENATHSSHLVA